MKKELIESICLNVAMYNIRINNSKVVYDNNRNYIKNHKKIDIVKFYLENGKEMTIDRFNLSNKAFYKIIDGIGYVGNYNASESKYEYMQTEEEMFGFKCSYEDLSEIEKQMYNARKK